jgi:hypothetical protein
MTHRFGGGWMSPSSWVFSFCLQSASGGVLERILAIEYEMKVNLTSISKVADRLSTDTASGAGRGELEVIN